MPPEVPASRRRRGRGSTAGSKGSDTNGSQFFIFVGPSKPFPANPTFTIFGHVTDGMATTIPALMIAATLDQGVTAQTVIETITITET